MSPDANKALRLLRDQEARMQAEIFTSPPATWEEFKIRLGEYQQNVKLKDELLRLFAGEEDDDKENVR